MRIRTKITWMIASTGILASLVFSVYVLIELVEQPYELFDAELEKQTQTLIAALDSTVDPPRIPERMIPYFEGLFWVRIFNDHHEVIYSTEMTKLVDLPLRQQKKGYTINTSIPENMLPTDGDDADDDGEHAAFRVRVFSMRAGGRDYLVQIGRAMDRLDEEIRELLITLALGLTGSTTVLIISGYLVAGRILRPLAVINRTVREINDRTLDKRLPLGPNRDELHELSSSLNTMFDRLHHSFRQQKDFLAGAAHELKTPLTIIRLFFEEMLGRRDLPAEVRESLACRYKTLSRMERLVKNLLDVSRLELKESFEPRAFDLPELVGEVADDFATSLELAALDFSIDMPDRLEVYADRDMIRRVLINLIDNGIKYNFLKNGRLRLQITVQGDHVVFLLHNTGPGIPADELSRVFEQFYRVEKSRSLAHGGSGLGLTIVSRIVRLHGGHITMESEEGAWARVRILLPRS